MDVASTTQSDMSTKKQLPEDFVFTNEASVRNAPYIGKAPEKFWANSVVRGFGVVVSKPDEEGNVERWYAARYGKLQSNGTVKDTKTKLGLVTALTFSKAAELATGAIERARDERSSGKPSFPTLLEAFDAYMQFKLTVVESKKRIKPTTEKDYRERWADFVPTEWHGKPLNEVGTDEWTELRMECTTALSYEKRLKKPVSESRFDVLLRGVVSGLYNHARLRHAMLVNPIPIMKKMGVLTKRTPMRHAYIASENLRPSIELADQEMRAPQRDILYIGILTGWRDSLIRAIPLDRIKQKKRAVEWRDTDEGGPYAEEDGNTFDYPVSEILWERVFAPRLASVKPGQKYLIESGRKNGAPFKDLRDSLKLLDKPAGVHVTAHVLRKTMLTLAPSAGIDTRVAGQLAMHKSSGGGLTQTGEYQKRDFVQMKSATNKWATWLAETVGWTTKAKAAPALEGFTPDMLAKLQALASMDPAQLEKVMRVVEAVK